MSQVHSINSGPLSLGLGHQFTCHLIQRINILETHPPDLAIYQQLADQQQGGAARAHQTDSPRGHRFYHLLQMKQINAMSPDTTYTTASVAFFSPACKLAKIQRSYQPSYHKSTTNTIEADR